LWKKHNPPPPPPPPRRHLSPFEVSPNHSKRGKPKEALTFGKLSLPTSLVPLRIFDSDTSLIGLFHKWRVEWKGFEWFGKSKIRWWIAYISVVGVDLWKADRSQPPKIQFVDGWLLAFVTTPAWVCITNGFGWIRMPRNIASCSVALHHESCRFRFV
jgi:hypothetical protein